MAQGNQNDPLLFNTENISTVPTMQTLNPGATNNIQTHKSNNEYIENTFHHQVDKRERPTSKKAAERVPSAKPRGSSGQRVGSAKRTNSVNQKENTKPTGNQKYTTTDIMASKDTKPSNDNKNSKEDYANKHPVVKRSSSGNPGVGNMQDRANNNINMNITKPQ